MTEKQCRVFGLPSPFSTTHYNIKNIYKHLYPMEQSFGMVSAYRRVVGGQIEGTHHRGGDDAKNIAYVFSLLHILLVMTLCRKILSRLMAQRDQSDHA